MCMYISHLQIYIMQDIAGSGCFSIAMIGRFDVIKERGAWMYSRLFWESGVLGQSLYLEAHAFGISAAGIGSYFDDPGHSINFFRKHFIHMREK